MTTSESDAPEEPNNPRLEIAFSKPKIGLLILYNLLIVGLGMVLFLTAGTFNLLVQIFFKLTAIAGIMFFGSTILLFFIKLFQKKPGFTVDQAGFIDNADAISAGRIFWEEITEIGKWQFMGQVMIMVKVKDPKRIINTQNFFKKILMRLNWKRFETPVSITCGALQIDHEKLFQILEENLRSQHYESTD